MAMSVVLSIMMLAALVLFVGAFALARKGAPRKQVWLMVLLATIIIVNVAILTVPSKTGSAPIDAELR